MSFPTKLLSTSPSLHRDYGLIRNQILASSNQHKITSPELIAEEDRQDDALEGELGLGRSSSRSSEDTSNISIPEASSQPSRSRKTSVQLNTSHAVTIDHSRGARTANLYGATSMAMPVGNQRPSLAHGETFGGYTQVAGIPSSFILGGQHMMPPKHADMRSQKDIMSDMDENDSHGRDEDYIDDEPTPMPRSHQAGWLSDTDRTPRPQAHRPDYVHNHSNPSETTSLIRRTSEQHSLHGDYIQGAKTSWSRTGASSGWDLQQPNPPGPEELIEIAAESASDNIRAREARVLIQYMIPTWGTHILELSLNIVSVFSLGHLGVNELAASSLSSMTANVTGYSVIAGFVSALDSVLPSAYTSQPKTVGLFTQRMAVIVAMLLPPIIAIWLFSEDLLLLLGQEPIVAALAGTYLRILSLGLPGYAGFEICRRYLQAQGLFHAPTIVLLFVSPLNALLNWLLVWGPDSVRLGFIGAPIASVISSWLMCLLCFAQCYVAPRVAWDGFTPLAFTGLKPIARLGFHGTIAMVSEWWSWEIVGLTTSLLGTASLAAQSVLLVSSSIVYQLPYALSVAGAVRVGNLLGARQPRLAKSSSEMTLLLSLATGTLNSAFFLIFRKQWGGWFTEDEEVIKLIYDVMPILAAFQVMDSVTGAAGGILRGIGMQKAAAVINVTAYYAIGIPIGLVLTFSRLQLGLDGLWLGLTVALCYSTIFCCLLIRKTNWDIEVEKTMERMGQPTQKPNDLEEPAAATSPPS